MRLLELVEDLLLLLLAKFSVRTGKEGFELATEVGNGIVSKRARSRSKERERRWAAPSIGERFGARARNSLLSRELNT